MKKAVESLMAANEEKVLECFFRMTVHNVVKLGPLWQSESTGESQTYILLPLIAWTDCKGPDTKFHK